MQVPTSLRDLVKFELAKLVDSVDYPLSPESRESLYLACGPSNVKEDLVLIEARHAGSFPLLSEADRVRARLALLSAKKVVGLWRQACSETEANFNEHQNPTEYSQFEEAFQTQRREKQIELISIYDVPRAFLPIHIIELTELFVDGQIKDFSALRKEANECWQLYGESEQMEREYYIKWACQDALYEALGWSKHNPAPPGEHAVRAFAGVSENHSWRIDVIKRNAFWRWWLSEALPQAFLDC